MDGGTAGLRRAGRENAQPSAPAVFRLPGLAAAVPSHPPHGPRQHEPPCAGPRTTFPPAAAGRNQEIKSSAGRALLNPEPGLRQTDEREAPVSRTRRAVT